MNAKISQAILNAVNGGLELKDAVDSVLGVGTYERIAGELYETLRGE